MRVDLSKDRMALDKVMEFDHVIIIGENGDVSDAPSNIYAPELHDGELEDSGWTLLNGYSGQCGYAGPVMHDSEFIGGRMAEDILSEPGVYVAIVNQFIDENGEGGIEGWAVARKNDSPCTA